MRSAMATATTLAIAAWIGLAGAARAADDYPPVTHRATVEECGACHMVFPPQMLPARSWRAIMAGLDKHFGDDASLKPAKTDEIARFLTANAADAGGREKGKEFLKTLPTAVTPLRITELPHWIKEHDDVKPAVWSRKSIKAKSNCVACHTKAVQGDYDEDRVKIPD